MRLQNCIKFKGTNRKVKQICLSFAIFFMVSFIFILNAQATNFVEINVSAASQVKPGDTLNIWVTVANLNVENISINFDLMEFENPFSDMRNREVGINTKEAKVSRKEVKHVDRTLLPVGGAKNEKNELRQEFFTSTENRSLTLNDMRLNADKEKQLNTIISQGVGAERIDVAVPSDITEGQTFSIPVKVLLSESGAGDIRATTMQSVDQMITFTVTSNPVPRRAVLIIVDGARADKLYQVAADNPQGNFSWMINNGVKFFNAVNAFPSITVVNHPSILTGTYPGKHGIASAGVFNKATNEYTNYYSLIGNYIFDDINNDLQAPTIYENMNPMISRVFTEFVNRGANNYELSYSAGASWQICESLSDSNYCKDGDNYVIDDIIGLDLHDNRNFNLTVIWLAGNDFQSHAQGPNSTTEVLNNVDVQIGRLKDFYGQAIVDETIFVVTSDHGHTQVNSSRNIDSNQLANFLEANGYYKNALGLNSEHDYYVGGDGGGSEEIYIQSNLILNDESSTDKTWSSQPRWGDIQLAAHAFYSQDYVDTVLVRYQDSNGYRVYKEYADSTPYTLSIEDYFNGKGEYVDAVNRINKLDSQRSGDLILLANYTGGYFFDSKAFSGDHGNLNPDDSYVPLIISGPGIKHGTLTSARTVDIAPTIANLLGFSMPEADGIPLDIKNRPPNTPSTPTGSTSGHASTTYSYSTSATDPDGDAIKYLFDWGDGTTTETAHYSSGTTASASHIWGSTGTYNVKVKAIDGSGASSDWSNSLSVSITGACSTSSDALANAIVVDRTALTSTAFDGNCRAARIFNSPVGFLSATEGNTFLILSSGRAANIPGNPTDFRSTDFLPEGSVGDTASLALNFVVPGGATKLKFDFRFMSEEYPEYVGSEFNDFFNAYLTDSTGTHQIAFDTNGNIINVNNNFFDPAIYPAGTVFNGATPKLTTTADVTPGDSISLKFEVGDVGDGVFDTAVFIDNVRFESEGGGGTSAKADVRVTKHGPTTVEKGKQMTYTINYYNIEEGKANNVVVTDILPGQASFVSAPGGTYNPATHSVSWNLGTLQKFSSGSLSLIISVPDSVVTGTILSNSVSISTTSEESNTQNNNREWSTTITDRATLPPNVEVEPTTTNYNGAPKVYWDNPITFTYHGDSTACGVSININLDDGGSDVSGPMTRTLSTNEWTFTYTFYPRYGSGTVTYTVTHCDGTAITTNHDILVDPSGWVENKFTGERIEGATVTLKRFDATLQQFAFVNPGDLGIDPHINPQTTDKNGGFGWMVSPGIYRVEVGKAGYFSTYSDVSVPPEVTDLAIKLEPMDIIPPTTTALLSGSLGNNGWYNSNVQVTLTATDNIGGSGVNKIEYSFDDVIWIKYTAPLNISNEGIKTVYYRSTDNASNVESTKTQTISIDRTPPTITGAATTSPNTKGWYNADVVVHFIASDEVSGIDTVTPDQTLSIEAALQSVTGTATDKAGNSASATISDINIDKTPPDISISGVSDGSYYNSDVTPVITISDTNLDAQSITLNGASYTSGTVVSAEGSYTLVAYANDMAGNSMIKTVNFVIDKTAPEAAIRFDVISKDLKVYDSETGDEAGYAALPSKNKGDEKGWKLRQYTLRDSASNILSLVLKYKKGKKQAEVNVISAQYNGGAVIEEVNNKILVRYAEGSSLKELEQKIEAKKLFAIEAKYKAGKGETEIKVNLEGHKEQKETRAGIVVLELLTNNGGFKPRY